MKDKKIQIVKTSGLIGVLGLAGVTSAMIFWPWGLDTRSLEVEHAKQKAEVIAYQIIEIYKEAKAESQNSEPAVPNRGLASVQSPSVPAGGVLTEFKNQGRMGMDPWGRPYNYRIISTEAAPKLLVWSNGPNGDLDSKAFVSDDPKEALSASVKGDDVRVQLSIQDARTK